MARILSSVIIRESQAYVLENKDPPTACIVYVLYLQIQDGI
jgi:hypothetical protein